MSNAILTFKSHTSGKNADVAIYEDRVEWVQKKSRLSSPGFWAATIFTGGLWALVLLIPSKSSYEMIPTKRISSVIASRKTIFTEITVIAGGNTISFNVTNAEADTIRNTLNGLILAA